DLGAVAAQHEGDALGDAGGLVLLAQLLGIGRGVVALVRLRERGGVGRCRRGGRGRRRRRRRGGERGDVLAGLGRAERADGSGRGVALLAGGRARGLGRAQRRRGRRELGGDVRVLGGGARGGLVARDRVAQRSRHPPAARHRLAVRERRGVRARRRAAPSRNL